MDAWFDIRGKAILRYNTEDATTRREIAKEFPDIPEKVLLLSAVNAGLGNMNEVLKLVESKGLEWVADMVRITQIGSEAQ